MGFDSGPQAVPVGFGRGRKTNRLAVIDTNPNALARPGRYLGSWMTAWPMDVWTREVLAGVHSTCEQAGLRPIWHFRMEGESLEEFATQLTPEHVDACVLIVSQFAPELMRLLSEREIIHVMAFARSPRPEVPWADCDNVGGVVQLVHHFATLGHRRIGFLASGSGHVSHEERKDGYLKGMQELGLPTDPQFLHIAPYSVPAADIAASGRDFVGRPDGPTSVICASDLLAEGLMGACWERGLRVPQDIAIAGFDDLGEAAHLVPALTSARQPVKEVAGHACYLAACALEGQLPETGWQITVPVTIMVRASCGAQLAEGRDPARASSDERETATRRSEEIETRLRELTLVNQDLQEILHVVSHDLRSPLITIDGFAGSLQKRCGELLDERGRQQLARIRQSAASLGELIDVLVDMSRDHTRPIYKAPLDIAWLVGEVLQNLEEQVAGRGVTVTVEEHLPTVLADDVTLRQVFTNLIGNALKYLGDQPYPKMTIGYALREGEHEFSVSDNGIGISLEHQDDIFKPFRRVPDTGTEGTGVGLATVRRNVQRHGGRIWVESEPGQGAIFRFTLPRTPADQLATALPSPAQE